MSETEPVLVTLPGDVNQVDESGYVWAFLDTANEPERVRPGALIVAGDEVEPFLARVVDEVDGPGGRTIVHLDVFRRARRDRRRAPPRQGDRLSPLATFAAPFSRLLSRPRRAGSASRLGLRLPVPSP